MINYLIHRASEFIPAELLGWSSAALVSSSFLFLAAMDWMVGNLDMPTNPDDWSFKGFLVMCVLTLAGALVMIVRFGVQKLLPVLDKIITMLDSIPKALDRMTDLLKRFEEKYDRMDDLAFRTLRERTEDPVVMASDKPPITTRSRGRHNSGK